MVIGLGSTKILLLLTHSSCIDPECPLLAGSHADSCKDNIGTIIYAEPEFVVDAGLKLTL